MVGEYDSGVWWKVSVKSPKSFWYRYSLEVTPNSQNITWIRFHKLCLKTFLILFDTF